MSDRSDMTAPKLSITLVNTNNRDLLRACLASLYEQEHGVAFEVLLVDNASTDGSADMVRHGFPAVRLIENDRRRGFGANHNRGIRQSRGEHVLVLNEDTVVRPGALRAMCDVLDAEPGVGAVGCRLENPDGTLQRSCYRFPSPGRCALENLLLVAALPDHPRIGDYRAWPHDERRDVEFVSGAAIAVRREVIETVGVFDERFFIYAEETDWCRRMRDAGWKVAFVPDGTIVHHGGQSSAKIKDRQFCEFNRSARRYIRKHHGLGGVAVQHAAMLAGAGLRLTLWSGIYLASPERRGEATRQLGLWSRLLRWWAGLGPHAGIAELARSPVPGRGAAGLDGEGEARGLVRG